MPDLRPGQLKRLGRIAENNPERAYRVADRMEKRASREDRGKEIADNAKEKRTASKNLSKLVSRQDANLSKQENIKRKNTAEGKGTQVNRPDTPLADSPEPKWYE